MATNKELENPSTEEILIRRAANARNIKLMKDINKRCDIFYMAEFHKTPNDPEYLADIAREVELGIKHLISRSQEMGSKMLPENTTVEPYQRFEHHNLINGVYINTRVTK